MTTMASDHGTSSSSGTEDEAVYGIVDESNTLPTSNSDLAFEYVDTETRDSRRSSTPDQELAPTVTMTARAYQLEMLEESLKQNIIVAMDTGSGKTQVAILRIQAELERSDKIAWFLTPTVALAEQQFEAIRAQIPGVQSKLIVGSNNVDAWSTKPGVWDAVLLNTRIIVSTYQILFDAVAHAFIPLSSIGLVVIDEAHNPVKMNSVRRLMVEHYAPSKAKGHPVPHILGLTASPLMRSDLNDLELLEQTLDAVCKTPSKHRDELMALVKPPEMKTVSYGAIPGPEGASSATPTMTRLKNVYHSLRIEDDPYFQHLLANPTPRNQNKLNKVILDKKTFCRGQVKSLYNRASDMCDCLGPWAADYYIHRAISTFQQDPDCSHPSTDTLADRERQYLSETFRKVNAQAPAGAPTALSPRVQALLNALESHQGNPLGIVFVRERTTVAVLSHILTVHPKTASRYRVGSMVGTSQVPGRRRDFLDLSSKDYLLSLQSFRKGTTNLLVATSVLEEGIDVPACNLVVCFELPKNLKSFIQRRGRARMADSQMYLLVEDDSSDAARAWLDLEREMKRKYEDDLREKQQLEEAEKCEPLDYPILRDQETGAQITIHDAKAHLEHFCATLSTRKFVDWSPFYVVHDLEGNPVDAHQLCLRKATVHLPVSLAPELRCFESLMPWPSEANACKDAAFQAYAKLYEVGLLNRHLLPIRETDLLKEVEPRPGLSTVKEQLNPWPRVAQAWRDGAPTSRRRVTVSSHEKSRSAEFELVLPVPVPHMEPFDLYWDHDSLWRVIMDRDIDMAEVDDAVEGRDHTSVLLAMAFGHRWHIQEKQYPVGFVCLGHNIGLDDMATHDVDPQKIATVGSTCLVRDIANKKQPYIYVDWLPAKPPAELVEKPYRGFDEAAEDVPYVVVRNWPKKVGLFRQLDPNSAPVPSTKPYPRVLPADQVRVDNIPAVYAHVGMMIPAITHALEVHLVAKDLLDSRLQQTGISDLSLVVMAISATAARGPTDYERIEFLGDSILKFSTTINCSAKYLKFPEGCLSPLKDKIVANSRLFRAAVDFGLDRYIIHKAFTLQKWRPPYVEDLLKNPPSATETRRLSTKTLADVVEALIGASYISGGIPKALACISLFLPDFEWQSIEQSQEILNNEAPADEVLPLTMRNLESLIGYTFNKKSLLVEAMTHPSCTGPGIRASLDRLEFLGDALLDYIVVTNLFRLTTGEDTAGPLDNATLHLLRTALVNADILGFLAMEWCVTEARVDVNVDDDSKWFKTGSNRATEIHLVESQTPLPLWSFMRHASPDMGAIQRATSLRHAAMRERILQALWRGEEYPWSLLCRLQAQKFYSDVFESVLGAVWVDSGSIEDCEAVVERAGILPLMRRLVRDGVHLLHPKEELGRLAVRERVEYVVEARVGEDGVEGRVFGCKVLVGGKCVGTAEGGLSREEARTRAAEAACRVLKGRNHLGKGEAEV
ncbi:P-loop containing nucleoside triphosphate hydrolase protein [Parathielavia appendiculata]|uniref:P-loop containing nucleoside triphosphate hydrolase protein n=1 Tax=Parathielavia appendiculata TaxID=2587402 RepID=A0AAN6Z299_9PEZI|nr:P-loop containing nucleoside triphosphate hydrolase protein [Parathielavia appendiculata]